MKTHYLDSKKTHDRWNRDLPPLLEIETGDVVEMDMLDSSGGQVQPHWTVKDFAKLNREKIHTLTGSVFVKGAEPGHTLEVQVEALEHRGWGWTSLIPELGLLPDRFTDPFLFIWQLEKDVTTSLSPATIPLSPFCGIMGVSPSAPGEHRTRPPGSFGGNLDIRQLGAGARLFLPVEVSGALFSAGDAHAAQGDGEVCINGIEMPSQGRFRFILHKDIQLTEPRAEVPPARHLPDDGAWVFIASREEFWPAARCVVNQVIDFLVERFGIRAELAYILCSITLDLKISQCVNQPMITLTGHLPKALFR